MFLIVKIKNFNDPGLLSQTLSLRERGDKLIMNIFF
jgi:hypothetical protein